MPTRKQRRRAQKERRHEYETVWVDEEGNELEEPPDDAFAPAAREKRSDGKSKSQSKGQPRNARAVRTPPPPSWRRAARRSLILGVVIMVLFYAINSKSSGSHRLEVSLITALLYTALFIPFTFYVDRFTYRRWQRSQGTQAKKR